MASHKRIPSNFTQFAPGKSLRELTSTYLVGAKVIARWRREAGVQGPYIPSETPMPDGLADALVQHGISATAKMFGLPYGRVQRWQRCHNLPFKQTKAVPVPADFADTVKDMSQTQLAEFYGVGPRVVKRWISEGPGEWAVWCSAAAERRRRDSGRLGRVMQLRQTARQPAFVLKHLGPVREQSDAITEADKAMRWLQKAGPCYPLRIYGANLPGYRFAGRLWQADELIAEAKRRGWQPDAWRAIAA